MLKIHDEFWGFLSVVRNDSDLTIRLSTLDIASPDSYKDAALEITLVRCSEAGKAKEELDEFVGELVWNCDFRPDNKFELLFDGGGTVEIEYESVSERRTDLTVDEVFWGLQWLSDIFKREEESSRMGWGRYRRLKDTLEFEIGQELKNLEAKRRYYESNNTNATEKFDSAIHVCRRVLNYVEQVDKDNQ